MPDKMSPQEFYKTYYPLAVKYTKGTKINPETLMAQFATESSWGKSINPESGFSVFGIKAVGGDSKIALDTTEENKEGTQYQAKADFKSYGSLDEAIQDYVKLMQKPRYKKAFESSDPEQQLKGIQDAGYGGKTYANLPSTIVRQSKKYIPMGKEAEVIDTKKELNAQLAEYKKKAKDGTLTTAEFKETKLLLSKAQTILGDSHDFNVFASDITKNVVRPYLVKDVEGFTKNTGQEIESLKQQLVKTTSQEEYDKINGQIQQKQSLFDDAKKRGEQIHDKYNKFAEQEQGIYDAEAAMAKAPEGSMLNNPELMRKESVKNYNELYKTALPDLYKTFEDSKRVLSEGGDANARAYFETPEFTYGQNNTGAGGGGSMSMSSSTYQPVAFQTPSGMSEEQIKNFKPNINDMTGNEFGAEGNAFALKTDDPEALKKQIDLDKVNLQQLQEPVMKSYDQPNNNADYAGYLMDIGRVGLGLKGAMEKLPEYNTSDMFNTYMSEATDRRNMGLSGEELGLRKQMSERAFAYDVKNIRNFSGGSAGVALGNLGRANSQLQANFAKTAADDEAVRRMNRETFYNAATQNEGVNQMKFGIENDRAMMNKQAGAGLVQDALGNIINRYDFQKQHGPGSQYFDYLNELTQEKKNANQIMEEGMSNRKNESIASLKTSLSENEKRYQELTGNYKSTDAIKNAPSVQSNVNWATNNMANYETLSPDQLKEKGITVEKPGEVVTAQRELPYNDPSAIKSMAASNGGKVDYNQVLNSPEHKVAIEQVHSTYEPKIAELTAKMQGANSVAGMKAIEKQIRQLEKERADEINRLTKEREKFADAQFDETGKYIGK